MRRSVEDEMEPGDTWDNELITPTQHTGHLLWHEIVPRGGARQDPRATRKEMNVIHSSERGCGGNGVGRATDVGGAYR